MTAVLSLALRRAAAAPGRWLAVALPVALAVALLSGLSGAGVVAGDHAARRALRPVPGDVVLSWNGGAGPRTDAAARRALAAMGAGAVRRGLLLVPARLGRVVARVGAVAPLAGAVRVVSGRLPRGRCRPQRCEVLRAAGAPPGALLRPPGAHVVIVGSGALTARAALGFTTRVADLRRSSGNPAPPVLLSGDPAGVDALPALASVARTQGWSGDLDVSALHAWEIGPAADRIAAESARLDRASGGFTVTSPIARLRAAAARADAVPGRLAAAGAVIVAALAAFLVLAAGGLRRGLLGEDGRLRRMGASAGQRAALAAAECAVPVAAGVLAGLAAAVVVVVARARAGGVDAGRVLDAAAAGAAGRAGLVAGAAWLLVLAAGRLPARVARAAAGGGLLAGAALLLGVLGSRDAGEPLPAAVVPVAAVTAGLLVALVLPVLLRRLARGPALLELAREPGAAAVAAAGLAVAVGVAGFAAAYHATLERSRSDRAGQAVPLAATVTPGAGLRSPAAARSLARWASLPGVDGALPVVRREAAVLAGPTRDPVALLAVPARAMGRLAAWRAAEAEGDRATLARRLVAAPFDRPVRGSRLPPGARVVSLPARAVGDRVVLTLLVHDADGLLVRVPLGRVDGGERILRAILPARARGGVVSGLLVEADQGLLATAGHQAAEGGGGATPAAGTLRLGALRAGASAVDTRAWRATGGATGRAGAVRYRLAEPALLRAPDPADRGALPVLADPATARDARIAGEVLLEVQGTRLRARVVGVTRAFPTLAGGRPLVLADEAALAGALEARSPGAGEPRELWLSAAPGEERRAAGAVAAQARRAGLAARTRPAVEAGIRSEPVERELLGAFTAAAVLAALLAVGGVAVAVRRALRDDALALADAEAQGAGPAELRRGMRRRGAAIAVAGVLPGVALAALLTALVADAVKAALAPAPALPLAEVVPWGPAALAALALALAAAAAAALAAAPAFREPVAPPLPAAEVA